MLALDRGGCCNGMAFKIAAKAVASETEILWMRERLTGAYFARYAAMRINGRPVRGLTFVINRAHSRYVGRLSTRETVRFLRQGKGVIGTCREYLENTVRQLEKIGVTDHYLHTLLQQVRKKD
jgi:cation transport protein ChaC